MTNFYYSNEEQLMLIREEVFGEKGAIEHVVSEDNLEIYKFLIAMSISYGLKMNQKIYRQLKDRAIYIDYDVKNRVFFEKCESASKDILYFEQFMDTLTRDSAFRTRCKKFFHMAS